MAQRWHLVEQRVLGEVTYDAHHATRSYYCSSADET